MKDPVIFRAQLLYQQGRHDSAADACRDVLSRDPQDAYAHALLALCFLKQHKYEEATQEAALGIHAAPDMAFCHYASGAVYLERNRFAEAEAAARAAIDLQPGDADNWSLLGGTMIARKRWKEALDAADHGLSCDPEHVLSANIRAAALVSLGQQNLAAQTITEVLRRNPHDAMSHANQGWTALHDGDANKALEHFRESLRLDPTNDWARDGMAQALKARYFIYRVVLRYYLWMSRFNQRGQWGLIIGSWLGFQVIRSVNSQYPALAPVTYPLMAIYLLFVLASWMAVPVFNLSIMMTSYGRYLLPTRQRVGAVLIGLLLALGLACTIVGWMEDGVLLLVGFLMIALAFPVSATTNGPAGRQVKIMGAYTSVLAVMGLSFIGISMVQRSISENFAWVLIACLLSNVVASMVYTATRKK